MDSASAKRIETLIRKRLTSAVAQNVSVAAEPGGVITLARRIAEPQQKAGEEKPASEYPGVTRVTNNFEVTRLSFGL